MIYAHNLFYFVYQSAFNNNGNHIMSSIAAKKQMVVGKTQY